MRKWQRRVFIFIHLQLSFLESESSSNVVQLSVSSTSSSSWKSTIDKIDRSIRKLQFTYILFKTHLENLQLLVCVCFEVLLVDLAHIDAIKLLQTLILGLTRGLTSRLPVTLNIRDNPKGVHTEERKT